MAGHGLVKEDPAIERFNRMREEAYLNFRWTRTTTRTAFVGFLLVPGITYFLAKHYYHKFDWTRGKGESLVKT